MKMSYFNTRFDEIKGLIGQRRNINQTLDIIVSRVPSVESRVTITVEFIDSELSAGAVIEPISIKTIIKALQESRDFIDENLRRLGIEIDDDPVSA